MWKAGDFRDQGQGQPRLLNKVRQLEGVCGPGRVQVRGHQGKMLRVSASSPTELDLGVPAASQPRHTAQHLD